MIYLIQHTIDQVAANIPDREAVRMYNQHLTYKDLAEKSNQLANTLIQQGVQRRDRVGIYLSKSLESVIAMYGIMKAGAAYVPLDPSAPLSRIAYMIQDCGIDHIITQNSKIAGIQTLLQEGTSLSSVIGIHGNGQLPVSCITWDQVYQTANKQVPSLNIVEQDLAYIIYTSGSTGIPKGIMHTHHSSLSFTKWAANAYGIRPEDRLSNQAPLHFDMSIFDFFTAAVAGATTVIIPDEYMRLPASYSKLLADEKITVFFTVPFALSQLLYRGVLPKRDLSALRWIIFGGDTHSPQHVHRLMKLLPDTHFSHMYGPAETNGCTYFNFSELPESADTPIPIGKMSENMEGIVVDDNDDLLGPGKTGELLVRSPSMMQGYWNRPDLNARVFFKRSVFEGYQEVFYRTGDLVEILEDGQYRFIGRKDRQVKVRGYRVEMEEIETLLMGHPQVEAAAIFAVQDKDGAKSIEAAVKLEDDSNISNADLSNFLKEKLPWYAVPQKIEIMAIFPRTGTGKINRKALEKNYLAEEASG